MRKLARVVISAAFAVATVAVGTVPASAAGVCEPFGCYISNITAKGFYSVSGTSLCSASSVYPGTLYCSYTKSFTGSVGYSSNIGFNLVKDSLSANFGVNADQSKTIAINATCERTFGAKGGRIFGVPEFQKHEFQVRSRQIGGGGANDPVVGSGWVGVPTGMKCVFQEH
ncbi:hypothetical protein [Lentzea albida]|uniref:Peptidase inhibitor family I36 n=1 Tax=Lentzea albida TaxID=65499 RepID=A0A1H9WUQ5_9PSEU|nr:hypothetical protein [Lentzea albida]SES37133.1 hypothetical protein SAMN04488000_12497 [Lentzea albida]